MLRVNHLAGFGGRGGDVLQILKEFTGLADAMGGTLGNIDLGTGADRHLIIAGSWRTASGTAGTWTINGNTMTAIPGAGGYQDNFTNYQHVAIQTYDVSGLTGSQALAVSASGLVSSRAAGIVVRGLNSAIEETENGVNTGASPYSLTSVTCPRGGLVVYGQVRHSASNHSCDTVTERDENGDAAFGWDIFADGFSSNLTLTSNGADAISVVAAGFR